MKRTDWLHTAFEGGSGIPTIWILLPRRLVQFKEAGYLREGRSLWEEEWWGKPTLPPTAQIRDNAKQSQKEKIKEPVYRSREIATERSKIKSKEGLEVQGGIPSSEDGI